MKRLYAIEEINKMIDSKIQDKPLDIVIQQSDCTKLFNTTTYTQMQEMTKVNIYNGQYCTKATGMFRYCSTLTEVNLFNTTNITDMASMFQYCTKLVSLPEEMLTGSNKSFDSTFYECNELTTIPTELNLYNCTTCNSMFYDCYSLTKAPEILNSYNLTNCKKMFYGCNKLTEVPVFYTNKVQNMENMFFNCGQLTEIPAFNASNVTNLDSVFSRCYKLTAIHMTNMSVSFKINDCIALEEAAIVEIFNNLATVSTAQTLTLGSKLLAKLTDEDKAIATNKGWTLA